MSVLKQFFGGAGEHDYRSRMGFEGRAWFSSFPSR